MNIIQEGFLSKLLQMCLQAPVECEFDDFIGAKQYEPTGPGNGYRNGRYKRQLKNPLGSMTLNICRDRAGEFQTELFDKYQGSEKALVLGISEMYFSGVAIRKVAQSKRNIFICT